MLGAVVFPSAPAWWHIQVQGTPWNSLCPCCFPAVWGTMFALEVFNSMLFLDRVCQVGFVFSARLSLYCKEGLNPAGFAVGLCCWVWLCTPGAGSKQIVSKVCVQRHFWKDCQSVWGLCPPTDRYRDLRSWDSFPHAGFQSQAERFPTERGEN